MRLPCWIKLVETPGKLPDTTWWGIREPLLIYFHAFGNHMEILFSLPRDISKKQVF